MKIGSIGYNYIHNEDFVMDRPNGIGCGLMLFIKIPAVFEINGKKQSVKENSFVILTSDTACKYRGAGETYADDWMYFSIEDNDIERFDRLEIPVNTVVHLGNMEELSQIMHILAYEHYSAEAFHTEIEEQYINILLMKLSRIIQSKLYLSSNQFTERNYRLTQLRSRIFTMPESIGSIDEMAAESGLSRSGFQHSYKKMFGVSVMTDIINGRLDRAKRLLSSTNLTIREISEKCGYCNEYNFMKQFKSKCGKTPTEFRKSL